LPRIRLFRLVTTFIVLPAHFIIGNSFGRPRGEPQGRRFFGLIGDTFTYSAEWNDEDHDERVVISQTYEIGVRMPGFCVLGPRLNPARIASMDLQTSGIFDTPAIFDTIDMLYTVLNAGTQCIQS
jgi:hypothetical protein